MFPSASRALLRRSQAARFSLRNASTTSEAATKAKETASKATSQASEGLTRVQSSAASGASKAGSAVSNTVSSIGGRAGQLIGAVQSLVPPTIYYSRVALELGKLIAQGRKMSPPDVATFQKYYQSAIKSLQNPGAIAKQGADSVGSMNPSSWMNSIRNMDNQQMISAGVVVAEIIGFFTVGEIIGRFKVIGYRGGQSHDEHH